MRTPDFLVVGAARAGTTSLHSYLGQHPGIFLPGVKEPCFFIFEDRHRNFVKGKFAFATRNFKDYSRLFSKAGPSQLIGEMSTPYLYLYEETIGSIRKYFQDYRKIKIVILLRDPAARAWSQYKWRVRDGREPLSFEEAVEAESERMSKNYSFDYYYTSRGFYFKQVKAYLENFDHVHIILFEDLMNRPDTVLKALCGFLGIPDNFNFKILKPQNESGIPRWKSLSRIVTWENRIKYKFWYSLPDTMRKRIRNSFSKFNSAGMKEMSMNPVMKEKLTRLYKEDILALQELINRDLSSWLNK